LDYLTTLISHKCSGENNDNSSSSSSQDSEPDDGQGGSDEPDYTIGVIVTYKSQEELINQLILESRNEYLKSIQVSTVDAF
jgi:hypothetical protein